MLTNSPPLQLENRSHRYLIYNVIGYLPRGKKSRITASEQLLILKKRELEATHRRFQTQMGSFWREKIHGCKLG